jgi:hypothetical protein
VRGHAPRADVRFGHDLALALRLRPLFGVPDLLAHANRFFAEVLQQWGKTEAQLRQEICVKFMRGDVESRNPPSPEESFDISKAFEIGVMPPYAAIATLCLVRAIGLAKRIETDRLHVGILSGLMNKPCALYDNSYGKNRAVFEASLKGRFPNLSFAG